MIAEKTSMTLSINYKKSNNKITEMERNMYRLEQYSRCECIEIAGIPNSITNDLKEYIILIFKKLWVVIEAMDMVACRRLGETCRVLLIVNRRDTLNILEEEKYQCWEVGKSWEVSMITLIPTIKEKSSLT